MRQGPEPCRSHVTAKSLASGQPAHMPGRCGACHVEGTLPQADRRARPVGGPASAGLPTVRKVGGAVQRVDAPQVLAVGVACRGGPAHRCHTDWAS